MLPLLRVPDTQETTTGLDSTDTALMMPHGNGDDTYEDTPAYAIRNDGAPLWVIVSFGGTPTQDDHNIYPFLQMTQFYLEYSLLSWNHDR